MQKKYNLKIGIISIYPFPEAFGAATNRIVAYAKGMTGNGAQVDVIVPFPTHNLSQGKLSNSKDDTGIYHNISYYCTSGKYRHRYKWVRGFSILSKFRQFYGYYTSYYRIIRQNKLMQYDAIIISTDGILNLFIYSHISKKCGAIPIFIFDEYPTPIRHKLKKKVPGYKTFLYSKVLPFVGAYVSISEKLGQFYNIICKKPTHILPIIVDTSRFDINTQNDINREKEKYLCYMGNMELAKDDIDNIIKAFSIIASEFEEISLHLYGGPKDETRDYLCKLINELKLKDRCFLKGKISADEVPYVLRNAHVLVSSQPDTVRASGGFPTKLGEYLTTGVPALITDVGENAKYVTDRTHLFFAQPGNPSAYSEKLKMILNNYTNALKVAKQGQEFVYNNFSHIVTSRKLLEFISDFKQKDNNHGHA
jgi:glycosyltransferase involved in cell wall biosynthesis